MKQYSPTSRKTTTKGEGCEPHSPAEEPTEEDRDFIVPDGYERERDETYVETEPEDSAGTVRRKRAHGCTCLRITRI